MNADLILAPMGVLAGNHLLRPAVRARHALRAPRPHRQRCGAQPADIPGGTSNPNFADLLEMPVLFYVVCLMALVAHRVDPTMLWLAWAYVVIRALHRPCAPDLRQPRPPHLPVRAVKFRGAGDVGVSSSFRRVGSDGTAVPQSPHLAVLFAAFRRRGRSWHCFSAISESHRSSAPAPSACAWRSCRRQGAWLIAFSAQIFLPQEIVALAAAAVALALSLLWIAHI